ncbi:uncharacterized protein LOC62_05G007778 [Vanrija pseudolonga]|uniref:Hemerythrin-like domain-containing protein n=1 Tax=Vanrija pseudolonga TaxID=143232 RepID=A0AAF0YCK4_9TREE|nr:hypothetical protein LOC62_05G007778 [Vanrija pseudolonga]
MTDTSNSTPATSAHTAAETAFKFKGDFRAWNAMSSHMRGFHNYFKYEFDNVYKQADGGFKEEGHSLPQFLREAGSLSQSLINHHALEENYIFPALAKKMPEQFGPHGLEKEQHKHIHDGLESYEGYIHYARSHPEQYDGKKLRAIMDKFRDVLYAHLDDEVRDLGAEALQKAGFTLDELRRVPLWPRF